MNKPNGQTVITPNDAKRLIPTLPVQAFFGVGPKTAARLSELDIHTGHDLKRQTLAFLTSHFGKYGDYLYDIARGIDERPVNPDRLRKSLGVETTFAHDLPMTGRLLNEVSPLAEMLAGRLAGAGAWAGNVIVKVKTPAFELVTRRMSLTCPTNDKAVIAHVAKRIILTRLGHVQGARLLGLQTDRLLPVGTERTAAVPLFAELE